VLNIADILLTTDNNIMLIISIGIPVKELMTSKVRETRRLINEYFRRPIYDLVVGIEAFDSAVATNCR
jgi:hypothetical protein